MLITDQHKTKLDFLFEKERMSMVIDHDVEAELLYEVACAASFLIFIVDRNVFELWGESIQSSLIERQCQFKTFLIEPLESSKNLNLVGDILDQSIAHGANRKTIVLGFGGGLIANIAGMVAGLMFRGVRLIHVPTTLLSMSDAILSKKQAVNSKLVKNAIGMFLVPEKVFISAKYLSTLPHEQLSAGMVELVKNTLAFDPRNYDAVLNMWDKRLFFDLVLYGIRSKQELLINDKHELADGLLLEYGHTIGHAIELTIQLNHGHAVGLGMIAAGYLSFKRRLLTSQDLDKHIDAIKRVDGVLNMPRHVDHQAILAAVKKDNKRGKITHTDNEYPMVVLKGIGEACYTQGLPLCLAKIEEIQEALKFITQ